MHTEMQSTNRHASDVQRERKYVLVRLGCCLHLAAWFSFFFSFYQLKLSPLSPVNVFQNQCACIAEFLVRNWLGWPSEFESRNCSMSWWNAFAQMKMPYHRHKHRHTNEGRTWLYVRAHRHEASGIVMAFWKGTDNQKCIQTNFQRKEHQHQHQHRVPLKIHRFIVVACNYHCRHFWYAQMLF